MRAQTGRAGVVCRSIGYVLIVGVTLAPSADAKPRAPIGVADTIESARFATFSFDIVNDGVETTSAANQILRSPDGTSFAVVTLAGDVRGDFVEARVFIGDASDPRRNFRRIGTLRTRALSNGFRKFPVTMPGFFKAVWLHDGSAIDFLWDESGISQVTRLPVNTGRAALATNSRDHVVTFASTPQTVLFSVLHLDTQDWSRKLEEGFVVTALDAPSLIRGRVGDEPWGTYIWFVQTAGANRPSEVTLDGAGPQRYQSLLTSLSPTGNHGIVMATPSKVSADWELYDNDVLRERVKFAKDPNTAGEPQLLYQLFLVDVERGVGRPLWDAPGPPLYPPKLAWSPNGRFVLLSPTFLPPGAGSAVASKGLASAIYDVATHRYVELAMPSVEASSIREISWKSDSQVLIATHDDLLSFSFDGVTASRDLVGSRPVEKKRFEVRLVQSANSPPLLEAVDRLSGSKTVLLDPNPELLKTFKLGRVEPMTWTDAHGRAWHGRLYLPVDYRRGRKYPLVIQNHGYAPLDTFSLYGPKTQTDLGPGISIYAAQALAGRKIMVLQMEDKSTDQDGTSISGTPNEARVHVDGFESAVRNLDRKGMIDTTRVGIAGWSAGGWYVEYALAHSPFKFAAAIASDNFDSSYFQAVLAGVSGTGITGSVSKTIGAPAVGEGLLKWLEEAPAFNAHRIRTPLRLQVESGFEMSLYPWEMFNALRNLKRPVEYVAIPKFDSGSHFIQNPGQVRASQEGAVDWFDFWLNDRKDPSPGKAAQYRRWGELRKLLLN